MSKRLLVVAASGVSADSAGRAIDRNYGDDVAVHIVAPASGLSRLDWLANAEDDARGDAEARADQIADAVHTDAVDTEVGDTDPVQAIRDALTARSSYSPSRTTRSPGSRRAPRRRHGRGSTSPSATS